MEIKQLHERISAELLKSNRPVRNSKSSKQKIVKFWDVLFTYSVCLRNSPPGFSIKVANSVARTSTYLHISALSSQVNTGRNLFTQIFTRPSPLASSCPSPPCTRTVASFCILMTADTHVSKSQMFPGVTEAQTQDLSKRSWMFEKHFSVDEAAMWWNGLDWIVKLTLLMSSTLIGSSHPWSALTETAAAQDQPDERHRLSVRFLHGEQGLS